MRTASLWITAGLLRLRDGHDFYPGYVSPDSIAQLAEASNLFELAASVMFREVSV